MRPRLLDLFCGAGGAARGYHEAGFEVVGVDVANQPNYPYEFHQADAMTYPLDGFAAIHASPPCQGHSTVTPKDARGAYPKLIPAVRERLMATGLPWVIENVEGARAEMRNPIRLCGSSFLLDLRRHRLFESNMPLVAPPCAHSWQTPRFQSLANSMRKAGKLASVVGVHGNLNYAGEGPIREAAMRIDWMTTHELAESIPPAYTEWIGRQLMAHILEAAA